MSTEARGSAAARLRRVPGVREGRTTKSAEQYADLTFPPEARELVRRRMPARIAQMNSHLAAVRDALAGKDPEASLVYVAMLRDACNDALEQLELEQPNAP